MGNTIASSFEVFRGGIEVRVRDSKVTVKDVDGLFDWTI